MIINAYNNLVDTMNNFLEKGYPVYDYHNSWSGYGFYLELPNKKYIECDIFGENIGLYTYNIKLMKHNSKYGHDSINDIRLTKTVKTTDYKEVEKICNDLIEKAKEPEKEYTCAWCRDKFTIEEILFDKGTKEEKGFGYLCEQCWHYLETKGEKLHSS